MKMKMKILLIIDIQKEFRDTTGAYERSLEFIKENYQKYDEVIATYFRQKPEVTDNYRKLLDWHDCMDSSPASIELDGIPVCIVSKPTYGISELLDWKKFPQNAEIHIIGCDLDACIMAACFNLWDRGYSFKILKDYSYICGADTSDIYRMYPIFRRNFGDCLI